MNRPTRAAALVLVDAASAATVGHIAYRLRFEGQLPLRPVYEHRYLAATVALAIAWPAVMRLAGLSTSRALRLGSSLTDAAVTSALSVGALIATINMAAVNSEISRAWTGLVTLGLLIAALGTRASIRRARRMLAVTGHGLEQYAIVGAADDTRQLHDDLTRASGAPFRILTTLDPNAGPAALAQQARDLGVDGLILPTGSPLAAQLTSALAGTGIDVLVAADIAGLGQRVATVAMMHGVPLLRVAGLAPRRRAQRSAPRTLTRGVAILGTRGIPGTYGGFETFAERLALHLVDEDVPTTVYCRPAYATEGPSWRGIRLITMPTIRHKYLDTVVHTAVSVAHLIWTRGPHDVVLCNAANAPLLLALRLAGRRVVMNVDGLEWRRGKWGAAGRAWYRTGEWLSVRLASVLVTDAEEVRTYYRVRHDSDSVMIPYGADLLARGDTDLPVPVDADSYLLYVSRWESENNPLLVATAHAHATTRLPLVMLGDATYDTDLGAAVRAAAATDAHTPGGIYGPGYRALQSSALAYIHATEVGGTHPALIEALGAGNVCLVMDTPENREVAGPAGAMFFHDTDSLAALIDHVATLPAPTVSALRQQAREHALRTYSWSAVGSAYLTLLRGATNAPTTQPAAARDAGELTTTGVR